MNHQKNELMTLLDLFADGSRSFRIPDYQRGYSWEKRQVEDMLKDIASILDNNYSHRHYAGTIVASLSGKKDDECYGDCYDIVDGQQRLTTLIILLNEIIKSGVKVYNDKNGGSIIDIKEMFVEKQEAVGVTKRRFKLNKETDMFFKKAILNSQDDLELSLLNKSHQNLQIAQEEARKWLNNRADKEAVLVAVLNNLGFMFYSPQFDEEIGLMFEVINNRGKELSELEKVKNYLIYYAVRLKLPDLTTQVNEDWGKILENLNLCEITSNEDENAFLRNCWIVYKDTNKNESYYVYNNLKKYYPIDIDTQQKQKDYEDLRRFVVFINKASQYYAKLFKQERVDDEREKRLLILLSLQQSIASTIPLVLAIYSHETDVNVRVRLLDLVEKLNFRYYGCHIAGRSDTGQGTLFAMAHQYYNLYGQSVDEVKIDSIWLEEKIKDYVRHNANDEGFVKKLTLDKNESGDYYSWGSMKYFLANYEESLVRKQKATIDFKKMFTRRSSESLNDSYDREHIWAVEEKELIDDSEERHINKRRLGNFVLLEPSPNIKVSNDRIEKKIEDYYKLDEMPKTLMLRELSSLFKQEEVKLKASRTKIIRSKNYWLDLYTHFFDAREQKLVNFALDRWRVDYPGSHIKEVLIDSTGKENAIYREIKTKADSDKE